MINWKNYLMQNSNLLVILLYVLAVLRLSRLLTWDDLPLKIGLKWRMYLLRESQKERKREFTTTLVEGISDVFQCKYCMGIWAAIIVYYLPFPLLLILGISGGQFLIEQLLDRE